MHLHQNNIIHADLALRNILYIETKNGYKVAISDFGLAHRNEDEKELPEFAIRWAAPEVLEYYQ